MTVQIETVSTEQANYLVTHLNLEDIQTILQGQGENIPLSQIQGMEAENLINFLVNLLLVLCIMSLTMLLIKQYRYLIEFNLQSKLESMLVMPNSIAVPQIGYLRNPLHLSKIRRRSNEVISSVYKQLYEHVHNPSNEYDDPSILMSRTPDLVYQILVNDGKSS